MEDPQTEETSPTIEALQRAIDLAGSQEKLAFSIGLGRKKSSVIANWILRKQVPAEHCRNIEGATGGQVTRYELRPDVFGELPQQAAA